jgi:hypothetical protein
LRIDDPATALREPFGLGENHPFARVAAADADHEENQAEKPIHAKCCW